mmetsp:Transcript_93093/g.263456  ORF Transcript_93093/g.263456 Transcript_93093/m.263456 type:complete len:204 (+) Transcript_93093:269-880(+)
MDRSPRAALPEYSRPGQRAGRGARGAGEGEDREIGGGRSPRAAAARVHAPGAPADLGAVPPRLADALLQPQPEPAQHVSVPDVEADHGDALPQPPLQVRQQDIPRVLPAEADRPHGDLQQERLRPAPDRDQRCRRGDHLLRVRHRGRHGHKQDVVRARLRARRRVQDEDHRRRVEGHAARRAAGVPVQERGEGAGRDHEGPLP